MNCMHVYIKKCNTSLDILTASEAATSNLLGKWLCAIILFTMIAMKIGILS